MDQQDREPFAPVIFSFIGSAPPMNIIKQKLIELNILYKCDTTCRFNNKKELLLFPADNSSEQILLNNCPQQIFGTDVNYTSRSPRGISKSFSLILKSVDSSIDEKDLLRDIQAIESEVTAIHRIRNAALDKPTSLVRLDVSSETCRDRLLAQRKLVVTPFAFPTANYIQPIKIIRCFKCQELGHYAQNCNNQLKCSKCSGPHAIDKCISSTEICPNCGENHRASYPACKVRLLYINELKNKQFSSFVMDTSVQQQCRSYAAVAQPQSSQLNGNESINEEILKQVSSVGIIVDSLKRDIAILTENFKSQLAYFNQMIGNVHGNVHKFVQQLVPTLIKMTKNIEIKNDLSKCMNTFNSLPICNQNVFPYATQQLQTTMSASLSQPYSNVILAIPNPTSILTNNSNGGDIQVIKS
ncbi:unnamed protein product [Didymodactylos carnosus]|uniref:CCHC-type domain-containing protein n=1 Tax=Didymodactylos carnosus TaxID=1234261 RepID=A0A814TGR9_9BILA|nr:unnamed protein product [Didymodactylos carnosus]CAF1493736.1 unnamed protein product [Didymodactylos carnosus]CAF3924148.1 unnamed protein product [Didymodactylos carnosus]CAF4282851.1 unnamed protein product [Didymodactylos carnosus]